MSPKRDTSQKRHEILDAAVREFQAVGYDSTSMDRIAKVPTGAGGIFPTDVPKETILIQKVSLIEEVPKK